VRALNADQGRWRDGREPGLRTHAWPRPLRLAFRFAGRIARGNVDVPRHLGLLGAAALLGATAVYGAWVGGHVPGLIAGTSNSAGLTVDAIRITGHSRTTNDEVLAALNLGTPPSIFALDVDAARAALLAMPWVASASVAKALPGSVSVELTEKQAAAIWQSGTDILVLDETGKAIGPARLAGDRALPAFVGTGAETTGFAFAAMVRAASPTIADAVRVHVRVSDRRWDLLMENGLTVRLPEERPEQALVELEMMQAETAMLSRDITAIDMRVPGRTTMTLGETAMAALFPPEDDTKASKKPKGVTR
jgi:cell division protein FtsQ